MYTKTFETAATSSEAATANGLDLGFDADESENDNGDDYYDMYTKTFITAADNNNNRASTSDHSNDINLFAPDEQFNDDIEQTTSHRQENEEKTTNNKRRRKVKASRASQSDEDDMFSPDELDSAAGSGFDMNPTSNLGQSDSWNNQGAGNNVLHMGNYDGQRGHHGPQIGNYDGQMGFDGTQGGNNGLQMMGNIGFPQNIRQSTNEASQMGNHGFHMGYDGNQRGTNGAYGGPNGARRGTNGAPGGSNGPQWEMGFDGTRGGNNGLQTMGNRVFPQNSRQPTNQASHNRSHGAQMGIRGLEMAYDGARRGTNGAHGGFNGVQREPNFWGKPTNPMAGFSMLQRW